ncbi:hypothetical protein BDQ17DRAFT_1247104 [Cyathus striatus]|nr:hypothetical protein BDQ17DRAFT_1247104 [Cyathus striatus]
MLKNILIKKNSISSLGGAVLGLVHCIFWGSQFPMTVERNLWRISALGVAVSAILVCLWYVIGYITHIMTSMKAFMEECTVNKLITMIPVTITIGIYIVACYYLILEAFLALRSLPPSALETVQWSNFLPHV